MAGTWQASRDAFALEALISVAADGAAVGSIAWRADRPPDIEGTEDVRGRIAGASVELEGYRTGRGLACDQYRIILAGDGERGTFTGISWAFGSWQGRMHGLYQYSTSPAG